MEKKFKITLPKQKVDEKQRELHIRKVFGEDYEKKEGLLSKVFVFIYLYGPIAVTDLTDKLQKYYKREFDRVNVYRSAERLFKLGVLQMIKSGDILTMMDGEKLPIHEEIERIHRQFLGKISPQFRNRYGHRNYIWFLNGEGNKYLEWCCKLNNFNFEE